MGKFKNKPLKKRKVLAIKELLFHRSITPSTFELVLLAQ